MARLQVVACVYGQALAFEDGADESIVARSKGASAAFIKEMVRYLAQAAIGAGSNDRITVATVEAVLGEAVGCRIIGLTAVRAGKEAPPFDACGEDL